MTTHSGGGQGDQSPHEGVVLPPSGESWTPEQQRQVTSSPQPAQGQPWGQPWGPDAESSAPPATGGAPVPPGQPAVPPTPPPGQPAVPPTPPPGQPAVPPTPPPGPPTAYAAGQPPVGQPQVGPPQEPFDGVTEYWGQPSAIGDQTSPPGQLPPAGWGAGSGLPQPPTAAPSMRQQDPQGSRHHAGAGGYGGPLPSEDGDAQPTQMLPPVTPDGPPPVAPGAEANRHIPAYGEAPVPGQQPPQSYGQPEPYGQHQSYGQQLPQPASEPAPADPEATQMLRRAQPPAAGAGDSTAMLRSPLPPESDQTGQSPAGGMSPDATATGRLPVVNPQGQGDTSGQGRAPLAEFDALFRADSGASGGTSPGGSGEAGATQSLPLFDQVAAQQSGGAGNYDPPHAGGAGRGGADPDGNRKVSPAVLAGAAVLAVVGVLIGAFVGFGGDSESGSDDDQSSSASDSSADPGADKSQAPDPGEEQAKKLDKLLERSNNSRTAVIKAVQNIKSCKSLGAARTDLQSAAKQRNGLVTSLGKLSTDEIPNGKQLNSALVKAWKASAKADSAYAAWAKQVSGKKGCQKGKARSTQQQAVGNRASGEATAAKKKAAALWNPTAKKYDLTERQITQL